MDAVSPPKPKVLVEAHPFFPYMKEENFDPRLKPVLDPYKKRMGFLPNALKLYAYRPEIAETLWALNSKVMRDPTSTLDQLLKRKLAAVACAVLFGLSYNHDRWERRRYIATLSPDARERLRRFEMVSNWRAFRDIEARHTSLWSPSPK